MDQNSSTRRFALIYGLPFLLMAIGIAIWLWVPVPQKQITITTGADTGLYYRFAQQLALELKKEKIELKVQTSAGSLENLQRLQDHQAQLAIIQGGVGKSTDYPGIEALAAIFDEQVWVFYRPHSFKDKEGLTRLTQLKGRKIAMGMPGSGTRVLAEQLLSLNQIQNQEVQIIDRNAKDALHDLKNGHLDAAILVSGPQAPILMDYLKTPGLQVMSFEQADAYALRLPFLKKVTVPRGVIDLPADLPAKDLHILSTPAVLAIHPDLHPALITPIMRATEATLEHLDLLQKDGDFPSAQGFSWPHNADASYYLKTGPSFLHRHLPFWTVVWIERAIRLIVPLIAILIPLINIIPTLIRMRVDALTGAVYKQLRELELKALKESNYVWRDEWDQLQAKAMRLKVPKKFSANVYELRMYVDMIREKLEQR